MRRDWLFALLLCLAAAAYFMAPYRQTAVSASLAWWREFTLWGQSNLLPNERGLNVAVLDRSGQILNARAFDSFASAESGFASYVESLPKDVWVIVAVQDDGATNLSAADLKALKYLGGTAALAGQIRWSYILVGRPGLGEGAGREWLAQEFLDLSLAAGDEVAGKPLPVSLRIRSAGFGAGSFASLSSGPAGWDQLRQWIRVALRRG
ncbi:MAG: interleukin-like EMT inducer domain-containing protein [Bacillota bacterium]